MINSLDYNEYLSVEIYPRPTKLIGSNLSVSCLSDKTSEQEKPSNEWVRERASEHISLQLELALLTDEGVISKYSNTLLLFYSLL